MKRKKMRQQTKCGYCGKIIWKYTIHNRNFCDIRCRLIFFKTLKVKKQTICNQCGKIILKWHIGKINFCGDKCKFKFYRTKTKCDQCGKVIWKKNIWKTNFCGDNCMRKYFNNQKQRKVKIAEAEFNKTKHFCDCGCGKQIFWKKSYMCDGIPKYITTI